MSSGGMQGAWPPRISKTLLKVCVVQVAAQVLFIHPDHNLAVLQYEPKSVEAGIAVKAAEISSVAPNTRDEVGCEPRD